MRFLYEDDKNEYRLRDADSDNHDVIAIFPKTGDAEFDDRSRSYIERFKVMLSAVPGSHVIHLSNGLNIIAEEGKNCLSIGVWDGLEVEAYLCEINNDGVLVFGNSGSDSWMEGLIDRADTGLKVV